MPSEPIRRPLVRSKQLRACMFGMMAALLAALSMPTQAIENTRDAQDFPSRVIRVVVAFPAGCPTDFVARLLADRLKPQLGQNVILHHTPHASDARHAHYPTKGEQ